MRLDLVSPVRFLYEKLVVGLNSESVSRLPPSIMTAVSGVKVIPLPVTTDADGLTPLRNDAPCSTKI